MKLSYNPLSQLAEVFYQSNGPVVMGLPHPSCAPSAPQALLPRISSQMPWQQWEGTGHSGTVEYKTTFPS